MLDKHAEDFNLRVCVVNRKNRLSQAFVASFTDCVAHMCDFVDAELAYAIQNLIDRDGTAWGG